MNRSAHLLAGVLVWAMLSSCAAASKYPWDLTGKAIPAYQIIATDNPIKDEYIVTYTVIVCADKASTRDKIKLMGEKIIENLPPHNMAIICFLADPSERSKDWSVARIWWGTVTSYKTEVFPEAGDYSKNTMKIAMKGQELPGDVVEKY